MPLSLGKIEQDIGKTVDFKQEVNCLFLLQKCMVVVVIAVSSVFITDGVKDLRLEMFNKIIGA